MTASPVAAPQQAAVRPVRPAEVPRLARTLTDAFFDDPVFAWFFTREQGRQTRIDRFFRELVLERSVLPHDAAFTTDDVAGGALWLPPGEAHAGTVEQLRMLPLIARICGRETLRALRGMSLMEQHHPRDPHWYLWFVGVTPERQGAGLGGALMQPILERCDAQGLPAYLEATSARSRDLYLRHGFEVTAEVALPDDGPPMWLMWRRPR